MPTSLSGCLRSHTFYFHLFHFYNNSFRYKWEYFCVGHRDKEMDQQSNVRHEGNLFVTLFLFVCMVIPLLSRSRGTIVRPSGYSFLHLLQSKSSHVSCALDVRSHSSHTSRLCSRVFFSGQCHSSGDERAWIRPWNNRKP